MGAILRTLGLLLWLWLCLGPAWGQPRVLVISIDGLRPEFYQDPRWEAPTLRRLSREGASALRMLSVFPSVTYVNHTSLVTGVRPGRHGIFGNNLFSQEVGPLPDWCLESRLIQAPALWDLTHQARLVSAGFSWPVSVGATLDWNIPECFHVDGIDQDSTETVIRKNSTAGLFDELPPRPFPQGFAQWDDWLPDTFALVWRKHQPSLALMHVLNVDWNQHLFGPESPETRLAVKGVDNVVARLLANIDPSTTTVLVLGDHGFAPVSQLVCLNRLFYERGWITMENGRVRSFRVMAQANGGSAAIFCKDAELEGQVLSLLRQHSTLFTLVGRAQLDAMDTFPGALCAVSAKLGYSLRSDVLKPFQEPAPRAQGQHGHLPRLVPTGLIAWGRGVEGGRQLGEISILQVAPTVAQLLGLPHEGMEGRPLKLSTTVGMP